MILQHKRVRMKTLLAISALFVFLPAVSLRALSGQQGRANEDVEEFISYYCGEDTVGAFREQHPELLYAPRNAESDPYLSCRKAAVVAKLNLDTHRAGLWQQNKALRTALKNICENSRDDQTRAACRTVRKGLASLK